MALSSLLDARAHSAWSATTAALPTTTDTSQPDAPVGEKQGKQGYAVFYAFHGCPD